MTKKEIEKQTIWIAEYILQHKLTLREAEEVLNIPRPTLHWRIKNVLPRCSSTLKEKLDKEFEINKNRMFLM